MSGNPYPATGRTNNDISQGAVPTVPRFIPAGTTTPSLPRVRHDLRRAVRVPSLVGHLELGPLEGAVPSARRHARAVMQEWEFGEDCACKTELLVSELVTNALHASRALNLLLPSPIHLWLKAGLQRVTVTVWDANPQPPVLNETVPADAENGRGLMLIDYFAEAWGWFEPARIGGKCVWCEVVDQPDKQG
jgi:anti-sigma regulatory factor (Ser/Thr protein kinase)